MLRKKLANPFVWSLCAALPLLSWQAAAQAPKPYDLEDFIREDKFKEVALSPKGTYVAITVPEEDKTVMLVIKPDEGKVVRRIDVTEKRSHIFGVTWVSDQRLMYYVEVKDQLAEIPTAFSAVYFIDADGDKPRTMSPVGLIDPLLGDDKHIIASIGAVGNDFTVAAKFDVYTGTWNKIAQAPVQNATLIADNAGAIRFAIGEKKDQFSKLYYRGSKDAEWELINDEKTSGKVLSPWGFSPDNRTAYLRRDETTGPDSVIAFDTASKTQKTVARDSLMDPTGWIYAIGKRYAIGVYYAGATPRYQYFEPESPDAKAHRALQKAFPGQVVLAGGYTTSKNEVLVRVYSDREPGAYYAMNLETRQVSPMMFAADWLRPERLALMRDVVIDARDGRKIPGLLSVPAGSDGKNLPMILYPHGGPHNIHDNWGFDRGAQILAAHGYAVLQVNYRGSSGYGREHVIAGYKQWGLKMQDDLTDATRWAIAQGIADPKRICIFGASYGGYAALMGAAKEPDLYRCVAGQVGVYDLDRMRSEDTLGNDYMRRYYDTHLNDGALAAVSPNRLASRIKVPVFLSAGHEDEIAPVEHTEMMENALKEAGVPVETLYFKHEGHGIYKLEHRREFYGKLLTFLSKHLGGRAPVIAAPPAEKK